MEEVLVRDIMTREPITIKPDTNLLECARKIVKKKVGSLIITEGKKLRGYISEKDVLWALVKKSKKDLKTIKAIDISPRKIITIKPTSTIKEALSKMNKLRIERLPVVHEGDLVGLVTAKDILNFHPEFYPELEEFAKIREESKKLKRIEHLKGNITSTGREGICAECGAHDILHKVDGVMLCSSCASN